MKDKKKDSLQIGLRIDTSLMDEVLRDVNALGTTSSEFVRTILKRYYSNGKKFTTTKEVEEVQTLEAKVKELEKKLETKGKELTIANKNLKSHADRLDKMYKEMADLKTVGNELIEVKAKKDYFEDKLSDRDGKYGLLCNEYDTYKRFVKEQNRKITLLAKQFLDKDSTAVKGILKLVRDLT